MTCYVKIEIAKPNTLNVADVKRRWVSLVFWCVQVLCVFENHRRYEVFSQVPFNPTYGILTRMCQPHCFHFFCRSECFCLGVLRARDLSHRTNGNSKTEDGCYHHSWGVYVACRLATPDSFTSSVLRETNNFINCCSSFIRTLYHWSSD